jgi:pimeloyl-ACP methyl ester carboxylesterase
MRMGRILLASLALAAAAAHTRYKVRQLERAHPPTGRFVTTQSGNALHYTRSGKGRPVILLHGAGVQHQDMEASLGAVLGDDHEVFAFDRPGHGHSDALPTAQTAVAQATTIMDAARLLKLDRPIVIGHSAGAAVALACATEFPEEVAGLVLIAGALYPMVPPQSLLIAGVSIPVVGDILAHTLFQPIHPRMIASTLGRAFAPQQMPPAVKRTLPMQMLSRPTAIRASADDQLVTLPSLAAIRGDYGSLRMPVAVFAGTDDRIIDAQGHARRFAGDVPQARLHLLRGIGHMAHHFARDEIKSAVRAMSSSA